ncbi:MAG: M23 family metallopeptidase [Clostridia bacterium]
MKITHLPFNGNFKVTYIFGQYDPNLNLTRDKKHHGIDMVGLDSSDVFATCVGRVVMASFDEQGYGNLVKIEEYNTNRVHFYAHLASINVVVGQSVTYTTKLGVMGDTGNVTGRHTHYEIRENNIVINPTSYMNIPNSYGVYNSNDYIIETESNTLYKVIATHGMNVRYGPGTNYNIKPFSELTKSAQKQGGYVLGIVFTALEIKDSEEKNTKLWARTPSGWVCIDPQFCQKI